MLTFFDAAVIAAGGNGVPAGLFIPRTDLPGVTAGEFATATSQVTKEGKAVLAFCNALYDYYAANSTTLLGLLVTRAKASVSDILDNLTFTFQHQYVGKLSDGSFGQIPLPSSGANSGIGKVAIAQIFANAAKVTAEGAIASEGVVIPWADLTNFGGSVPSSIASGQDNRDTLSAIDRALADILTIRATGVSSAITAATQSTSATITLAAAATAATDPTTGILAAELDKIATSQLTTSYTVQVALNQTAQTFDVNVAAA